MSEPHHLAELLEEWRQTSELEGDAIQQGQWDKVARCQEHKTRLQALISSSGEATPGNIHQERFQQTVRELILLELRNSKIIDERREKLTFDKCRMRSACGNLRKVRSAYGAGHPSPIWNSFS
jgi:hypothetical protein